MKGPLTPADFEEKLMWVMGDDGLLDMVEYARKQNPAMDVRPLVVSTLEKWLRWSAPERWKQPWELGTRDRALFLVETYLGGDWPLVRSRNGIADTSDAVLKAISVAVGRNGRLDSSMCRLVRIMPGIYAVHVNENQELYRVECGCGDVIVCDAVIRDELMNTLFGQRTPAVRH